MTEPDLDARRVRRRFEMAVQRYAATHDLLRPGERLLVAVSGGADSTALLLALDQLSHRGGFGLAVAHFDHGLRDRESAEREERFVRELALSLGLPFFTSRGDVSAAARDRKQSIETAAREQRYAFLAAVAQEAECTIVATGHTASDQAETVLMHLLRGAGLGGLAGMSPRSAWPIGNGDGLALVRPLLCLSRADTVAYCAANGVQPLEDESNRSPAFRRNRVRHELIPALREYNPRIEAALVRLADGARQDVEYLDAVAAEAVEVSADGVALARGRLVSWPSALRTRALLLAVEALLGDAQGFGERHLTSLQRLVDEGQTGDQLDLPQGIVARLTRESLYLSTADAVPALPDGVASLSVPGETSLGELRVYASLTLTPAQCTVTEVDAEAAGDSLRVRRRRPGDRFQPLGMSESKKLQDFLVDAHVARAERDSLPIFENQRGIIWAGGLRIAEWARPRTGQPTIYLSYISA